MKEFSLHSVKTKDDKVLLIDVDGEVNKNDQDRLYLSLLKKSIAEGIAFFFVILGIYLCQGDQVKFIFVFWCVMMAFGNVSGAHVNPIVSLGIWINEGKMLREKNIIGLILYITFQFIFGISSAAVAHFIYKKNAVHILYGNDETLWNIFICECFFTGTLIFVCLICTSPETRPSNKNYVNSGLICAWLFLIITAGIDVSGGCYNPGIYFVLNGLAYFTNADTHALDQWLIYLVAPIIGSSVFTLIFKCIFKPHYISKNKIVVSEYRDDDD